MATEPVTICLSGEWGVADTEWDPENQRTEITLYAIPPEEHEVGDDWIEIHVCTKRGCDRSVEWSDDEHGFIHS